MKIKKFKKTKFKFPENENIIGGDAPIGSENKELKKEMTEIYEKVNKKLNKKK